VGLPDRPQFKHEQIAALRFVFVRGKLGPSGEPLCMLSVGLHLLKEGLPGLIELDQDLVADLARQSIIGIRGLDQMIDGTVVEVDTLEEECLAHIVVGQIPEVFGGQSHLINTQESWIPLGDDMLLDQLHSVPSLDWSTSVTCSQM
jgi:hypothetical protein